MSDGFLSSINFNFKQFTKKKFNRWNNFDCNLFEQLTSKHNAIIQQLKKISSKTLQPSPQNRHRISNCEKHKLFGKTNPSSLMEFSISFYLSQFF
jgi:hypothetical protein